MESGKKIDGIEKHHLIFIPEKRVNPLAKASYRIYHLNPNYSCPCINLTTDIIPVGTKELKIRIKMCVLNLVRAGNKR